MLQCVIIGALSGLGGHRRVKMAKAKASDRGKKMTAAIKARADAQKAALAARRKKVTVKKKKK